MMWARNFDGQACEGEVSSLLVRLRRISKRVTALSPCGLTATKQGHIHKARTMSLSIISNHPLQVPTTTTCRNQANHPRCDSEWTVSDFPNMRIRKYPLGESPSYVPATARTISTRLHPATSPAEKELYNND